VVLVTESLEIVVVVLAPTIDQALDMVRLRARPSTSLARLAYGMPLQVIDAEASPVAIVASRRRRRSSPGVKVTSAAMCQLAASWMRTRAPRRCWHVLLPSSVAERAGEDHSDRMLLPSRMRELEVRVHAPLVYTFESASQDVTAIQPSTWYIATRRE
jgi:hypothetical protein